MRAETHHPSGKLLPAALLVSACLHAGLFALQSDPMISPSTRAGHGGLSLQLVSLQETTAGSPADDHTPEKQPQEPGPANNAPSRRKSPVHANTPRTARPDAGASTTQDSVTPAHEMPRQQASAGIAAAAPAVEPSVNLQSQVRRAMQPHFSYPMLARRRGWQGTVRIGMRISADGHISRLHIVETSPHPLLDRAALATLGKVKSIPQVGAWLTGRYSDIVLPVEYRLTDS